ncbi:MAG: hypothetical protein WBD50_00690 [Candidatus Rhabdochlamydia sp.]
MGITLALIAGVFNSLTNFCVKKGIDIEGTAKLFFLCQILASSLFALILGPLLKGEFTIQLYPSLLGICAGIILYIMLFSLGIAVEKGTPGLTFATLNSATILPGIIMAYLFGADCGFYIGLAHVVGLLFVIIGLFWGVTGVKQIREKNVWITFASMVFLFHIFLLCLFQYRAMLIKVADLKQFDSEWFTPFMFLTCLSIQLIAYLYSNRRFPNRKEIMVGFAGGLTNLLCTLSLLLSAKKALPFENAVIFPMASVASILLTNFWSQKLYSEEINWKACQLLVFGIIIGTINWKLILTKIGGLLGL